MCPPMAEAGKSTPPTPASGEQIKESKHFESHPFQSFFKVERDCVPVLLAGTQPSPTVLFAPISKEVIEREFIEQDSTLGLSVAF